MEYFCPRKKTNNKDTLQNCKLVSGLFKHGLIGLLCYLPFLYGADPHEGNNKLVFSASKDSYLWNKSYWVFPWGLLENCMNSAVLVELHKALPDAHAACPGPSGWQHRAYGWYHHSTSVTLAALSRWRALYHFLQDNGVKRDRSQHRPAILHSGPAPRKKVYEPLTVILWAQASKSHVPI